MSIYSLFAIVAALAIGVIAVLILLLKSAIKEREYFKDTVKKLENELAKAVFENQIKSENRKEADEKVNALHNGTLSADDILPKH